MANINPVKRVIRSCEKNRELVKSKIGKRLHFLEHIVYGVTYLLIGFTDLHGLYYAFGTFVLITVVFGDETGE